MIEFTKLWNRIDLDGFNAVKSDALLKRIAGPHRPFSVAAGETEKPSSAEAKTRRTNLNIEKWLKAKFREGFKEMHQAMATYDTDETGRINRKEFRHVLGTYGLHLRDDHALNTLLSRCGVLEPGPVAYTKLLERFQDRSDQGMTYEMLKRKDKRIIERSGTPGSTVTTIESKLLSMLQSDYLSLVAAFHKLDRDNRDVVTQSEFRALLESRFGLELTQTEFGRMISRVPLDEAGLVRYPEFLATFDAGRYDNKSLFDAKSEYTSASQFVTAKARSLGKLEEIIRRKLNENTSDFEAKFTEVDQLNQGWLTTESLYQLLLKVNIQPPVTREECRKLWPQFRLNAKNTLDWHEFVRHFLYDQETASFPNAKVAPPRKGDDDFNKRSNRLNGAQYFLKDSIRQMISWKFDEFQEQFIQLDPYRTGFITKEEFAHILKEIEPRLEDTDLEEISVAFDSNHDDRVNYVEFLRPFASRRDKVRQAIEETTLVVKSDSPLAKVSDDAIVAFLNLMNDKDVTAVTAKREFRRCDQKNVGRVTISDFKTICRRFGIAFGAEDVYRLATVLDHECTGYIPYSQLVKDLTVMQKTKK